MLTLFLAVGQLLLPCELFSRGLQFAPIYLFGVLGSAFGLQEKKELYKEPFLSLVFVLFVICSVSYCRVDNSYLNKACKFLASFSVCHIVLYYIHGSIINAGCRTIMTLCYLGKNSIVIYLTHFFFIGVMPTPQFDNQIQPFWVFIIGFALTTVILASCLFIGKICERFKWVDRIIYGRGW